MIVLINFIDKVIIIGRLIRTSTKDFKATLVQLNIMIY